MQKIGLDGRFSVQADIIMKTMIYPLFRCFVEYLSPPAAGKDTISGYLYLANRKRNNRQIIRAAVFQSRIYQLGQPFCQLDGT